MFKKILALSLLVTSYVLLVTNVYADETLTITTYYPSPYGSYNSLQTDKLGVGDNNNDGNLTSADVPVASGNVWIKGKVGIGTTNPIAYLEVKGDYIPGRGQLTLASTNVQPAIGLILKQESTDKAFLVYTNVGNVFQIQNQNNGSYGTLALNATGGNVGIGTMSPASVLSVNGGISAGTYSGIASPSNGMIISGKVGIGTTGPTSALQIGPNPANMWGDLLVSNSNGSISIYNGINYAVINSNRAMMFGPIYTTLNGNVGIGTTSPQSPAPNGQQGNLDANDVYIRGSGKWLSSSVVSQDNNVMIQSGRALKDKEIILVVFPRRFSAIPNVVVTSDFAATGLGVSCPEDIIEIANTYFRIRSCNINPRLYVQWIAVGQG